MARAGELIDFSTITDKLDALEPEISALQADVTENKSGIKKNSDEVHYNDKGYNIIANLVSKRGQELGYCKLTKKEV